MIKFSRIHPDHPSAHAYGLLVFSFVLFLLPGTALGWDWTQGLVDGGSSDRGQFLSMAVDGNGRHHLSYYRFDSFSIGSRNLMYATNPDPVGGGSWDVTVVDSQPNTGTYSSIAIGPDGVPHIAYYEAEFSDLKHAWKSGGTWQTEFVEQTGLVGQYASITVDLTNRIYISYFDATTPALKVADKGTGSWNHTVVDTSGIVGLYTAIDATGGLVHVAYYDFTKRDLKYARRSGGTWTVSRVDSLGDVGRFIDVSVRDGIIPMISYYDVSNANLKFAERTPDLTSWDVVTVNSGADVGSGTSIFTSSRGWPYILYYDRGNNDLKISARLSGSWGVDSVAVTGDVGRFNGLYLDPDDFPSVAFYDETAEEVQFASGVGSQVGIWEPSPALPVLYLSAHPNPVRPPATLAFNLPRTGPATVRVFDVSGRLVRTVFDGALEPGPHEMAWDGRDAAGRRVAAGRYLATLRFGGKRTTTGLVVIR